MLIRGEGWKRGQRFCQRPQLMVADSSSRSQAVLAELRSIKIDKMPSWRFDQGPMSSEVAGVVQSAEEF